MRTEINAKIRGVYRIQVVDAESGVMKHDTGEFTNEILDGPINAYNSTPTGNPFKMVYVHFGTGTSATNTGTSVMEAAVPPTGNRTAPVLSVTGVLDIGGNTWTIRERRVATTLAGQFQGNLAEIGMGESASSGATEVLSRALILDQAQQPTVITAGPSDQLITTYDFYFEVAAETTTQIDVVTNGVAVDTTVTLAVQRAEVGSAPAVGNLTDYLNYMPGRGPNNCGAFPSTAVFGAPGELMSNLINGDDFPTHTDEVMSGDGTKRIAVHTIGIGDFNVAGGISVLALGSSANNPTFHHYAHFKARFVPPIPKDATRNMVYTMHCSVARG